MRPTDRWKTPVVKTEPKASPERLHPSVRALSVDDIGQTVAAYDVTHRTYGYMDHCDERLSMVSGKLRAIEAGERATVQVLIDDVRFTLSPRSRVEVGGW